jgi:superfamily II DNA or RNA helicase
MERLRFFLNNDSKYQNLNQFQKAALTSISNAKNTDSNHVVVLPCGTGKTALALAYMIQYPKILYLTYEKASISQVISTIKQHTNARESHIVDLSSSKIEDINPHAHIIICSYAFLSKQLGTSTAKSSIGSFILNSQFDVVVFDECHHTASNTYYPLAIYLLKQSNRSLAMTATFERSDDRDLSFLGNTIYKTTAREVSAAGLIANINVCQIFIDRSALAEKAHAKVNGIQCTYINALHVNKLRIAKSIIDAHLQCQHKIYVSVEHLLSTKIYKRIFKNFEVLSSGTAVGADSFESQDAHNLNAIKRFNDERVLPSSSRYVPGLISTAVAESAVDLNHPAFCAMIVADAHGGTASALQRIGRLARTNFSQQKTAFVYELVTNSSTEQTAAAKRCHAYQNEGYSVMQLSCEEFCNQFNTSECAEDKMPDRMPDERKLLLEILSYNEIAAGPSASSSSFSSSSSSSLSLASSLASSSASSSFTRSVRIRATSSKSKVFRSHFKSVSKRLKIHAAQQKIKQREEQNKVLNAYVSSSALEILS